MADAENTLRIVLDERYDPHCKRAIIILARLEQPDYYNKTIGPKFRASVEQVKQWFIEAQGFYDTGRFQLAKKRCEQILNVDATNIAARRFEEKIDRAPQRLWCRRLQRNPRRRNRQDRHGLGAAHSALQCPSEIVVENTSPPGQHRAHPPEAGAHRHSQAGVSARRRSVKPSIS
ncbi:MAG: hypothetical protein WDN28_13605 [Chthoniobacter sp.]